MLTLEEKTQLYRDGCKVICHIAEQIKDSFERLSHLGDSAVGYEHQEKVIDASLIYSVAPFMETLGDAMNGHDMVDDEADAWVNQVFERMQKYREDWKGTPHEQRANP